jgi:uncharacterized membrane protein YkoI
MALSTSREGWSADQPEPKPRQGKLAIPNLRPKLREHRAAYLLSEANSAFGEWNMRKYICLVVTTALAASAASAAPANSGLKGGNLSSQAKVTLATARATALAARPGTITDQELEREKGGSGLRYSFDMKSHGKSFEVGVDAKTGKVLENGAEGPDAD